MGQRNKLLLPVRGMPMIRHVVKTYRAVTSGRVLVVTGFEAPAITAALDGLDTRIVHNPDFADGQQTSVTCGLRAAESCEQMLIGLGDQPALTPDDLRLLLAAQTDTDPARISIPVRCNQRGNPIVVTRALHAHLLANPVSPGCKTFIRDHPEQVQFHSLPSPGFYADVDTPEAYNAFVTADLKEVL